MSLAVGMIAGILIATVAVTGCLDATPAASATPGRVGRTSVVHDVNDTFDLATPVAVSAAGMSVTDPSAVHYSPVPAHSSNVFGLVTWDVGAGFGAEQECMVHDGTGQRMGTALSTVKGPSPLAIDAIALKGAVEEIAIMCGASGEPAFAVFHRVHVALTYTVAPPPT